MNSMGSLDSDEFQEVGLESMMVLAGKTDSSATQAKKEANGKHPGLLPVPQSRVAREKGEEMQLSTSELISESERLSRQNQVLTNQLGHVTSRGQSSETKLKQQHELALIASYKEQLQSKQRELDAAKGLRQDLSRKDDELRMLRDKCAVLQAEIDQGKFAKKDVTLRSLRDKNATLQKEIVDLKKQVEESRRLANTREAEKKQLRKEADKIKGQLFKMEQMRSDAGKTKQSRVDQLAAENDDLKSKLQIQSSQVENLSQLAHTRGEEKERLAKEVERLQGELLKAKQIKSDESKAKQDEVNRLTVQISDLKRQLQEKSVQVKDLSQLATNRGEENAKLTNEVQRLRNDLLILQKTRTNDGEAKRAKNNQLTEEIRNLSAQLQTKNTQIEELRRIASGSEDEKTRFAREAEDLKKELQRMQQVRCDDNRIKQVELERLNVEIGTLKGQLQIKDAQVEDLSQLASARGGEKKRLDMEVKKLQAQLLKVQQARSSLIDDDQAKRVEIEELTQQLTLTSREVERLSRENQQLKRGLEYPLGDIAGLTDANRDRRVGGSGRPEMVATVPTANGGSTVANRACSDNRTCPMCQKQFPSLSQQDYERHVEGHF